MTCRTDNVMRLGSNVNGSTAIFIHRRIIHCQVILNTSLNSTPIEISLGPLFTNALKTLFYQTTLTPSLAAMTDSSSPVTLTLNTHSGIVA